MTRIYVVGIGAGHPEQLTLQAMRAVAEAHVFFLIDKSNTPELDTRRDEIIRTHATAGHRIVHIPEAERDRKPGDYQGAVRDWHHERCKRLGAAIQSELGSNDIGAILVWGDPALYDSTLRVLQDLHQTGPRELDIVVVPGVSAINALAAAHGVVLHGIGESLLITTGRRLATDFGPNIPNVAVMLDGQLAFTQINPTGVEIYWGAYVGMPEEVLVRGPLADVAPRIIEARTEAREQIGWIMDAYLLRRTQAWN